ncbi:MAG: hypothetical protein ACOYT4_05110 [Nanoarchaeota archaeon]
MNIQSLGDSKEQNWNRIEDFSDELNKRLKLNRTQETRTEESIPKNPQELEGFIYIPSINLYVAKERSLNGKNWNEAHEELQKQGNRMLIIPEFWKFIDYLKNEYPDRAEAQKILEDIFKVGNWRAEWLDAHFEKKGKDLYVNYYHEFKNGKLIPKCSEKLESCLMEDCYADLNSINNQGLLTQKSSQNYILGQNSYFYHPRNNKVARFDADSDWADLGCYGDRSVSDAVLGVRAVREGLR